jgi:uncharacterized protein YbjT (DUF2867 family)
MKVLLTGATGYIGGQLRRELQKDDDVRLRLLVRDKTKIEVEAGTDVEIVVGSTFEGKSLRAALSGVDVAYYLIHSMAAKEDFEKLDRLSAENFLAAAIEHRVKRIIYLGGLGHRDTASTHLLSRIETGEILSSRPDDIQTLWFRAGIIIGAGSASFEIIRHLVNRIPLMTTPRWVRTRTQPISISDVVRYLLSARSIQVEGNLVIDVGSEEMTFQEMLLRAARIMGKRRLVIPVPLLSPRLSSLWLILFSPVHFRIVRALIDGLKSETVVTNDNARRYFPDILPLSFEKSVELALALKKAE